MTQKLNVFTDKTLKLSNVLCRRVRVEEYNEFEKIVEMMESYIKSKGYQQVGPLIQYTKVELCNDGHPYVQFTLMCQANNYINHVEQPYTMESTLRVKNCLYVRFVDEETKMKFAYDKLGVYAYEEDIELKGDNYTVFVNNDDITNTMTADIFMECVGDE